jgi:hypothetical protein
MADHSDDVPEDVRKEWNATLDKYEADLTNAITEALQGERSQIIVGGVRKPRQGNKQK